MIAVLVLLPVPAAHAAELADGTYTIDYVIKKAEDESVSMANDYWEKPARLIVENGAVLAQVRINHSSWVTAFKVPDGSGYAETKVIAADEAANTRVAQFAVKELSAPLVSKIHVTVESIDYDHDYTIRLVFDPASLKPAEGGAGQGGKEPPASAEASRPPAGKAEPAGEPPASAAANAGREPAARPAAEKPASGGAGETPPAGAAKPQGGGKPEAPPSAEAGGDAEASAPTSKPVTGPAAEAAAKPAAEKPASGGAGEVPQAGAAKPQAGDSAGKPEVSPTAAASGDAAGTTGAGASAGEAGAAPDGGQAAPDGQPAAEQAAAAESVSAAAEPAEPQVAASGESADAAGNEAPAAGEPHAADRPLSAAGNGGLPTALTTATVLVVGITLILLRKYKFKTK